MSEYVGHGGAICGWPQRNAASLIRIDCSRVAFFSSLFLVVIPPRMSLPARRVAAEIADSNQEPRTKNLKSVPPSVGEHAFFIFLPPLLTVNLFAKSGTSPPRPVVPGRQAREPC